MCLFANENRRHEVRVGGMDDVFLSSSCKPHSDGSAVSDNQPEKSTSGDHQSTRTKHLVSISIVCFCVIGVMNGCNHPRIDLVVVRQSLLQGPCFTNNTASARVLGRFVEHSFSFVIMAFMYKSNEKQHPIIRQTNDEQPKARQTSLADGRRRATRWIPRRSRSQWTRRRNQ